MNVKSLSKRFSVRALTADDVESVYAVSCGNPTFYQYHPPFVTRQSILDDMSALPPGKTMADKYYVGFFDGGALVAVMDLILGFPSERVAFIRLFMMNARWQGKGVGSEIISEAAASLKACGFERIRLGVDPANPQSNAFWRKNQFRPVEAGKYTVMERRI